MLFALFGGLVAGDIELLVEKAVRYSDSVRQGSDLWRVTVFDRRNLAGDYWHLSEITCNGTVVMKSMDTHESRLQEIGFLYVPDQTIYIAHIEHSWAGHGKSTDIYRMRSGGKLQLIHHTGLENGGPVFRDLDGDGEMEWIWDSEHWYIDYGEVPKWLLAYKPGKDGVLKLWQKIPNKHEIELPVLGGPSFMNVKEFGFSKG